MIEKEKLNLHLTTEQKEVIIRQGEALQARSPKSIVLNGTLQAPAQFKEGKDLDPRSSHILIMNDKGTIELHVQDTDPYTEHVIKGALTRDTILSGFGINTDRRWTIRDFLKFIKTMRFYFADRSAHNSLVESIQKWSVKIERVILEHNDNKGNSNFQLETKVQAVEGLVSKFDLNISLFQGYPKVKFTVEIGLDPKNTEVQLYLISDDLIELEIAQREKYIQAELDKFKDFMCSKIMIS